jgi:hypothetical protein
MREGMMLQNPFAGPQMPPDVRISDAAACGMKAEQGGDCTEQSDQQSPRHGIGMRWA